LKTFIFLLSLFAFSVLTAQYAFAQDSVPRNTIALDTVNKINNTATSKNPLADTNTVVSSSNQKSELTWTFIIANTRFLNSQTPAITNKISIHKSSEQNIAFYVLAMAFLFLGLLKTIYSRYFNNLLRVFFNTSLRQNQLKDQLLQAKLPSLLFNILFVLVGGLYLYFLLIKLGMVKDTSLLFLGICVGAITLVYTGKLLILQLAGWLTGFKQDAEVYIFLVFLVNKVLSIILLPMVVLIAFTDTNIRQVAMLSSIVLVLFMLILRFLRSFGHFQQKLKMSGFHFLIYILAIEVLPIFLIYKWGLSILTKN